MKKTIKYLTVVLASVFLTQCNDSETSNSSLDALQGTWISNCESENTDYKQQSIRFNGDALKMEYALFDDEDCREALYVITAQLDVSAPEAIEANATTQNIDYVLKSMTVMPKSQNVTDVLVLNEDCGLTSWTLGTATSILGLNCLGGSVLDLTVPVANTSIYTIISATESVLSVGNSTDIIFGSSDPENRPTNLDTVQFNLTEIVSTYNLTGTWLTDCKDEGDGVYSRQEMVFSGSNVTFRYSNGSNSTCSDFDLRFEVTFNNFQQSGTVAGFPFAKNVQYNMQTANLTPLSLAGATLLNTLDGDGACGFVDWAQNTAKNLMEQDCEDLIDFTFPTAGTTFYTILQAENNTLNLGDSLNNSPPFGASQANQKPLVFSEVSDNEDFFPVIL